MSREGGGLAHFSHRKPDGLVTENTHNIRQFLLPLTLSPPVSVKRPLIQPRTTSKHLGWHTRAWWIVSLQPPNECVPNFKYNSAWQCMDPKAFFYRINNRWLIMKCGVLATYSFVLLSWAMVCHFSFTIYSTWIKSADQYSSLNLTGFAFISLF